MAYEQIAEGNIWQLVNLSNYEYLIDEHQRGMVEIDLRYSIPQSIVDLLESQLQQQGVEELRVTTGSPLLRVYFRKGFPWLAVIAAIILALAVLAILIIGWRLFREIVPVGLQPLIGTIGIVVLIGLGLMVLTRRR